MIPDGFRLLPGALDPAAQGALLHEVLAAAEHAPFVRPDTPWGRPMRVEITSLGPLGWTSSREGYRYAPAHPVTGRPWPPMPQVLLDLWAAHADPGAPPDSCLVNLYRGDARMGLHQDRDEADFSAPVLSLSLGAEALFRYGGLRRSDPTRSVRLRPGDALVIGGASRLIHHGIDRLYPDDGLLAENPLPRFLPAGGRCNLTLRRVSTPTA